MRRWRGVGAGAVVEVDEEDDNEPADEEPADEPADEEDDDEPADEEDEDEPADEEDETSRRTKRTRRAGGRGG